MALTKKDKENVLGTIECEGFDYTFLSYTSFDEIEDKKFHELRKKFVDAANELKEYIGEYDED